MKTLLVLTTGQTDVQLVLGDKRHKLDGKICGLLHDKIVLQPWSLVDAPKARSRDAITLPDASSPETDSPNEPPRGKTLLSAGALHLCTPKLDAVLAYLQGRSERQVPDSVLILETSRVSAGDPRQAGAILKKRLEERGVSDIERVAFLKDNEHLEDVSKDPLDAVVRQKVIATIHEAIAKATEQLGKGDRVYVATTGGLAAANESVNELVRLFCVGGPDVVALEVPDGDRGRNDDVAVEEKFHPSAGFRARWQALSLIERGNLLGAWGAASHLEGVPGQDWTKVVYWLKQFASSLPLPEECDWDVLRHPRMAVRTALRVEFALRAGDIPRAVHGTVAFFEAALWDGLYERVKRSDDPKRKKHFKFIDGTTALPENLLKKGDGSDDDRKCPFEYKDTTDDGSWYFIYDSDGGPAARLAKYFLMREALVRFDTVLGSEFRSLRNDVAHNEPTTELMDGARQKMRNAKLWSEQDTFLTQPLVQSVLNELEVDAPGDLLKNLLSSVRERLLSLT
jgi:hypothetical protein